MQDDVLVGGADHGVKVHAVSLAELARQAVSREQSHGFHARGREEEQSGTGSEQTFLWETLRVTFTQRKGSSPKKTENIPLKHRRNPLHMEKCYGEKKTTSRRENEFDSFSESLEKKNESNSKWYLSKQSSLYESIKYVIQISVWLQRAVQIGED